MGKYSDALLKPIEEKHQKSLREPETEQRVNYGKSLLQGDIGPQDIRIGNIPLGSVFTKEAFAPESEQIKEQARFGTQFKTGFVDDPQTQIRIYAATRFPDESIEEAVKRYGIHKGEIVYMGDDGKLYRETPDTWWSKASRFVAQTGAHLPSIVLSAIGATGGPAAPITVPLGAAGGEGIRKSIGALAFREPQTTMGNIKSMGTEAAFAVAGEKAGKLAAAGINKLGAKAGGRLVSAAGRDRGTISIPEVERLERLGRQRGIDLLPPQTTDSKRLADKFSLLGDIEQSADVINAARKTQVAQIEDAAYRFLDEIAGPETTSLKAGGKLVGAAKEAIKVPVKARREAAKPIYEKAFKEAEKVDIEPVVNWIEGEAKNAKGEIRNHLLKAKNTLLKPDLPKTTFNLDYRTSSKELIIEGVAKNKDFGKAASGNATRKIKELSLEALGQGKKIVAEKAENSGNYWSSILGFEKEGNNYVLTPEKFAKIKSGQIEVNGWPEFMKNKEYAEIFDKYRLGRPSGNFDTSLKGLHGAKLEIDRAIEQAKRDGLGNTIKRNYQKIKDKLLAQMDKASPSYKEARKVFADYSEEVTKQAEKTVTSGIAGLKGDQVVKASKRLFSAIDSTPETVAKARKIITAQNQEAWDEALRVYIQDTIERTKGSAIGSIPNIGGNIWKNLWGSHQQRKIFKAAMTPEQYQSMSDFMDILERAGMIFKKESATATRQLSLGEMEREFGGRTEKFILASTRPLYTFQRVIGDRLIILKRGRGAKLLAEAMTSEKAAIQLKRMKQLSPGGKQFLTEFSTFLGLVVGGEFSREIKRGGLSNVTPPRLKATGTNLRANPLGRLRAE